MILAAVVMLFQMQATSPKAEANRSEAVWYAENISTPAPFGAFAPVVPSSGTPSARLAEDGIHFVNLPDNDGTKPTPKATPVFPDAKTQFLSGVYIPDHFEPLPPLPDKHYDAVKSGGYKRLHLGIAQSSTGKFNRARRRLKLGRPTEETAAGSPERDAPSSPGQITVASE